MTQEQINADLFDQVKKLQDIKRRHEADVLMMAQENDRLRAEIGRAASRLYKQARSNDDYIAAAHYKSLSLDNAKADSSAGSD